MTLHTDPLQFYERCSDPFHSSSAREDDLLLMQVRVQELLEGKRVLELACGDGFWTESIAAVAESVHAIDLSASRLAAATARRSLADRPAVTFSQDDAFQLPALAALLGKEATASSGRWNACFMGRFWQQVPRQIQTQWLQQLAVLMGEGALFVVADESPYDDEGRMPIARTDSDGNTYKFLLDDQGERHEVMKNMPTDSALRKRFTGSTRDLKLLRLEHYYLLSCRLKP